MKTRPKRLGGGLAVVLVLALAAATATAVAAQAAASPCRSGALATTAHYRFAISLVPVEAMYTQAQVKAKHPTSGEVMLGGVMSAMGKMAMGSARHLEVHICRRASGAVVTGASPAITITGANGMTTRVPVADMEGIGMGRSDYHYGNNVALAAGSRITVTVTLRGERASVRLTVPKSSTGMSG